MQMQIGRWHLTMHQVVVGLSGNAYYWSGNNGVASGILLMPLPTLLCNVSLWTKCHCQHSTRYQTNDAVVATGNHGSWSSSGKFAQDQPLTLYTWQEVYQEVWSPSLPGSSGGGGSGPGKLHGEALHGHSLHHDDNNVNNINQDDDPLEIPGSFIIDD